MLITVSKVIIDKVNYKKVFLAVIVVSYRKSNNDFLTSIRNFKNQSSLNWLIEL